MNFVTAQKVSVTVASADLKWLRAYARKKHRGNLSSAFAEAARVLRQQQARETFIAYLGDAAKLTDAEYVRIRKEWG